VLADVGCVMGRPNQRTRTLGVTLTDHLAPAVTLVLDHLAQGRSACDGLRARTFGSGRGGSGIGSSTEWAALRSERYVEQTAAIREAIDAVETATKHLAVLVFGGLGMPVPAADGVSRCKEGQHGRDAAAWSDDVACTALPDKARLCHRHYIAWYRYRRANNIDTTGDFQPSVA
jgi:hypothetical protein